jgi:predicted ATP-dependent serine protease
VVAALASASCGTAPPSDMAFSGEVSLAGSVRPVGALEQRAAAAAAAGAGRLVCARSEPVPGRLPANLQLRRVSHVREALRVAIGGQ